MGLGGVVADGLGHLVGLGLRQVEVRHQLLPRQLCVRGGFGLHLCLCHSLCHSAECRTVRGLARLRVGLQSVHGLGDVLVHLPGLTHHVQLGRTVQQGRGLFRVRVGLGGDLVGAHGTSGAQGGVHTAADAAQHTADGEVVQDVLHRVSDGVIAVQQIALLILQPQHGGHAQIQDVGHRFFRALAHHVLHHSQCPALGLVGGHGLDGVLHACIGQTLAINFPAKGVE